MASNNPFALLTEPSTAYAPPEPKQDAAPANPFDGLAAYSTAPDNKVPRGTKLPGSVNGTEPLRWITINGHPIPIKAPSGADHMLPVPGNSNVLQDPQTKEHYFKTPNAKGEFESIWDTQRKVSKGGKIVSHVKGVGDHEWGDDPKAAEKAQKAQEKADAKEQKDLTTQAAGDTKEVLQQAAIPVTTAKETLAHQDKLYAAQVTKAQTNKKLSADVKTSAQAKANEAYAGLKSFIETTHDLAAGKHQGNDEDFVPRYKKQKLPEGMTPDQYAQKEQELRKQYRDSQAEANAAARVDDENKRFVATAFFHKQAWADQSRPLREGLKQTQIAQKEFKDGKFLTESTASRLQSNEDQVRTTWPLKTNTGRNADSSARPPQITTPPDFNQYNSEAPQPTPAQRQAAGRDVIAEHMDINGLPPMPRITIQPRQLGGSFLPMPVQKPAEGFLPDKTPKYPQQDDSVNEARASVLKGLQNANRGMAYNVPDKPITWDKDTLHHDGKPVGTIQRDEFGAPALYIDHGHDGQKVSPSLNSGHYYDGIPELSGPSPAHLEEFKASGVTKPEDVQKAWGQRRWSTNDLNDLVDQWTSSNDDERQDLIAQTNPSQANVPKGQRKLNTRELYKDGMISLQDARMLDHAFYGRKPGVEDPQQSFEQFKQSAHPDAKALAAFAHDNTTLNPIAAGASQDAYGRALTSWASDYLKRNATSPDFDRKAFISARDKMLQPLGQRASAWLGKTAQGLVGIVPALVEQPINVGLGLAKTASEAALEKAGVNPQNVKDLASAFGADQAADVISQTGIHAHSPEEREMVRQGSQGFGNSFASFMGDHLNYEVLKAAVTNLFSPVNPTAANAATVWEGKNGAKVNAATKELFDSIDNESMTPAKLKELSVKLRDASIELHGIKNFDATNKTGYDYNGRYDVSDPRSPLAQALAGYAETADPTYKEMFKQALSTSEGGDALAAKMSEYLQAHGHIAGTPVGAAMNWLNRLTGGALHYDNPDAWRSLSESAGNTVQPLQVMAIQEALGATSALPGLLKGAAAPIIKSTGRALLASGELANGASSVAKAMQKISTIPLDTAQSAAGTFTKQLGTSAMHGAGFMALQQPGMGVGQSLGDVAGAGAEGAAIGAVAGSVNAAARALDIRRINAAQNKAHEDFVGHWNDSFPHNPITVADSRQASHYMGPEEAPRLQQIRTLSDQFQAIKDKVDTRTATREEFEQLKPLRLQLDNLFVAQQHAMDGAIAATQEINGITDPNLKGWANAALKQLSGNPLTPVEEAAMMSATTESGLPLSTPNGDGTHTITDAGLATIEQVAPATRRAYFPSDETSQTTTPHEQPSPQPAEAGMPAPGDPSQEITPEATGAVGENAGTPEISGTVQEGRLGDEAPVGGVQPEIGGGLPEGANLGSPPQEVGVADQLHGAAEGRVEAPSEKVNPAPSSPEPATQAEPARPETVTEPAKATTPEEVKASTKAIKLPINQHIGKAVAAVATALGEKIVDTGIPSGYTSFGKHINWGTQIYDKVVPGGPIGQWMDGLAKANPQVHEYLQHTHTAPWLHRMWFGHDWLMNWHKIVDKFGPEALPTYAKELLKDNLTKQGIPLPGAQWIWEKGLVDRTEGNADWLSMNIGEEMSAGIAITGTAMLFRKLVKGEEIHDGWALTGMLVKAGTGIVQHNPILILTSAADAAIIAAANTKSIAKAFKLRAERRAALDKAIEPGEKKFSNFKAPEIDPSLRTPTAEENAPAPVAEGKEVDTKLDTPDYRSIARQQIEDQLKDSPALQDLVRLHEDTPQDLKDTSGMAVGRDLSIQVSLPELEGQLRGMTSEEAKTHVAKVLDEEVRHIADTYAANRVFNQQVKDGKIPKDTNWLEWNKDYYGKIWDSLTPEQQKAVLESYKGLDKKDVTHKAMEALRIISQRRATGDQSETSMLWSDLPQVLLDHLKAVFDYLKELSKKKLPPILEEQLRGIEQVLKEHNYGQSAVDAKAHEAATSPHNDLPEPTEAQKAAENYKVGHIKVAGLDISVENPHGSVRKGVSPEGKAWETEMQDHYGRIKGSLSVDGDHLDVFVKPGTPENFDGNVFVVHQMDPKTGKLDEFKVMAGYGSIDEAKTAYQANYSKGWKGMGDVVEMTLPEFKAEMQRMTEVQKHPAMVELRKSNEELPAAAQKLWTPEVYAKAADFYKTGEVKALDGLTVIQKRRITSAGVKSSPEALAKEAAAEKAMRQQEADDKKHMRATTEKFLQSAPVKPEQDAAYMDAVKRGDTETAQKLVDEAAKAAGYSDPMWNFSPGEGISFGENYPAVYVTSSKEAAQSWGEGREGKLKRVFVSTKNSAEEGKQVLSSSFLRPEVVSKLKELGFDSVKGGRDWKRGDETAVFDPSQIKSADPITKDANGEVIPLSQRFNPQSDDIRYAAPIKRTPEEIAEMMKGLPPEERAKIALDNNLTAPKNAVMEEMQDRLNMPATQKIAALKETEVDALAKRKLATNPNAPREILNEFSHSGKAMSAADVRVLGKESGRIYSRLKEIEDLREKATPEERVAMAAESRELRPYLDELYQAISHTGTLSSDALRSRKYLEELNHSEAGIRQALRNAFGGRDLTPEEEATVAKETEAIHKDYIAAERQKAVEDAPKVSAALQRAVTDASKPITAPTQRTVSGAALKQIKSRAAKARELLAKSSIEPAKSAPLKSAPIKLSAEKLAAYADIAAEHLLEGRNISDELVKEYPDSRPHLSEIITEAKKVHAAILAEAAKAEQAKAAKAAAKLDPKNIMAAAKAGEYGDEISPQWMHELAMAHIVDAHKDGGTPTEGDIIKRMVKDVKTLFPDAGEREVREALVEYGKISQPNPEQMATELRQLKRISRLVLSKEDASEGKAPPKSQLRDKQSPEERQMRRELARIMDEHNVERQDPERALASRRDRLKSSLNNQIEDLQRIIDAKAKPERKLAPVVDDAEIKQLKARKQALVDQVNAMDSVRAATEAQRVETAIKAAKASQMEWERKLKEQEIIAKKSKTPEANAAVIEARKQRDVAKEAYHDMVDAKDMHLPAALFKEAERKLKAAVAHEAELKAKIAKGDLSVKPAGKSFKTPELEQAQARVKALNAELAKLRREAPRTPEQEAKARQIYLRQNDARITEIERRIREQDFAPKAKKEFPHNDLTTKSKVMLGKANERLQAAIKAKELADRSRFRRGMDATVHTLREIKLANLITSGEKLGGAALENVLTRPLSQLAAATTQIPRIVGITFLNDIRKRATYEGSLNQNAELKALRRMGSAEGLKAVWEKGRMFRLERDEGGKLRFHRSHGKSELDWMHKDPHFTEEMTSYFGRVHGMIKEPVRQGIYARSMKIRSDIAARMGIDFKTDEIAASEASARAYEDANREIFMGDNILTSGVRKMLNHWRNDKKNPGASKLLADAFEVLLPIINVPTNLAGRGMLLNPLVGFTKASWGIMKAFNAGELKNGAEKLTEKDAEIIMRAYKYGMLGTAAALYAWNNPQHFGGIYTGISHPGGNDEKTLKAGDIHVPGTSVTINHHLAHGPLGTHLNVVADARREYDRILEKTGKKSDAVLDAMAFLTMAPVRQLPYVQAILRAADPIKSLGQNAGSLVRDSLYGTAFTNFYDTRNGKPVKRSPRDFKEELMLGIPGLRQQVPESKSQEKADEAAAPASPFSGLPRPSRRPQAHRRPHR